MEVKRVDPKKGNETLERIARETAKEFQYRVQGEEQRRLGEDCSCFSCDECISGVSSHHIYLCSSSVCPPCDPNRMFLHQRLLLPGYPLSCRQTCPLLSSPLPGLPQLQHIPSTRQLPFRHHSFCRTSLFKRSILISSRNPSSPGWHKCIMVHIWTALVYLCKSGL